MLYELSKYDSSRIHDCLGRYTYSLSEHALSRDDCKRVGNAYYLLMCALLDVAEANVFEEYKDRNKWSRTYSPKRVGRYVDQWVKCDVSLFIEQQKCALQVLRHIPELGCRTESQFRKLCTQFQFDRSLTVNEYLIPLLRDVCLHPNHANFHVVNTIVQLISRLTLHDIDWIEEENIQSYKDFEDYLFSVDVQRYTDIERVRLIADMRDIIHQWFSDFTYEGVVGQHGYGATNQVRRSAGTQAKYEQMCFDYKSSRAAQYLNWKPLPHIWAGLSQSIDDSLIHGTLNRKERITRIQLVPKGINKKRVVSMEDTTNQFLQKNMQLLMSNHFDRHPEMHINLHDQERNRRLSLSSSRDRRYGTIDLSSASDSVSWELVKDLFRGTKIYPYLLATRTPIAQLPDDTLIAMRKAYPMGSALCFPIECTVFSAIIAAINHKYGLHTNYSVYGDDLVVHWAIFDSVVAALKSLGFIVNDTKSFIPHSLFKESCGIECWNGFDVSPFRLSRKFDIVDIQKKRIRKGPFSKRHSTSTQLAALYDLGNSAFDHGFMHVRKAVIQIALDYYPNALFSHNHETGFISYGIHLNNHLATKSKYRWFDPYTTTVTTYGITSRIAPGNDDCRYSKLIETYSTTKRTQLFSFEDRIESACGAARTRLVSVRVPLSTVYAFDDDLRHMHQTYALR